MKSQSVKFISNYSNPYFNILRLTVFSIVIISVSFCNSSTGKKVSEEQHKFLSSETDSSFNTSSDSNKKNVIVPSHTNGSFLYDLDNPDERYLLPEYLKEISGLAYYKEDRILCVQDEKADIYVLNPDKKEIVNKYNFGKGGDYEDIAVIGQTAYVIRSDGNIFEVKNFDQENRIVTEHKTSLSEKNNTESLAYDKFSNSLFIACKGSPAIEKENPYEGYKAIYQFDLREMKLNKNPQLIKSEISIQPSGLTIHPVNDEIYLISNTGKILIILNRNGKVLDFHNLDPRIFRQPEGICFSPSGDLFIANEGNRGAGNILRFNLRRNE